MSMNETDTSRSFEEVARHSDDAQDREPRVIEREIDATRADMRATLEALERRFSFDRLVDMTVGRVRARGGEFAGNLTDAATQNPMPLVLTTIGLAWMMLATRRGSSQSDSSSGDWSDDHGGTIKETIGNVRERAGRAADQVHGALDSARETLRHAADSTRETWRQTADSSRETFEHTAESLRGRAESLRGGATRALEMTREQAATLRDQAGMMRERVDRMLHEQPLMLGALGLAAGAIIGALLPTSEHEDRYLGEMRDKTLKNVAQKSRARLDTALDAVKRATSERASDSDSSRGSASRPH